jgi:hypothetical protein
MIILQKWTVNNYSATKLEQVATCNIYKYLLKPEEIQLSFDQT